MLSKDICLNLTVAVCLVVLSAVAVLVLYSVKENQEKTTIPIETTIETTEIPIRIGPNKTES